MKISLHFFFPSIFNSSYICSIFIRTCFNSAIVKLNNTTKDAQKNLMTIKTSSYICLPMSYPSLFCAICTQIILHKCWVSSPILSSECTVQPDGAKPIGLITGNSSCNRPLGVIQTINYVRPLFYEKACSHYLNMYIR